jgi:hypothetical protein
VGLLNYFEKSWSRKEMPVAIRKGKEVYVSRPTHGAIAGASLARNVNQVRKFPKS